MYTPNEHRYEKMVYNRCGKSGLKLPAVSLGIWQNFGYKDSFDNMEEMVHTAFDLGITHIDAANNLSLIHIFRSSTLTLSAVLTRLTRSAFLRRGRCFLIPQTSYAAV